MNTDVQISTLNFEVDFYTCDVSQYVGGYAYNSLLFINYGTSVVQIENITLQPNQQFEIAGNVGEITKQRFFINFGTSSTGNNLVVVRKRYINV